MLTYQKQSLTAPIQTVAVAAEPIGGGAVSTYGLPTYQKQSLTAPIGMAPAPPSGTDQAEWTPAYRRFVARWYRNPRQSAIAITSAIEAATLAEWLPQEPNTFRLPRQNRPPMAHVLGLITVHPTTVDQWLPYEPNQFRLRGPQRFYPAHTLRSGVEATPVEQWMPRAIRRVPRAWAVHPTPAQTVQQIVILPTDLREWETRWARLVPRRYQPRRDGYLWAQAFVTPPPEIVTFPLIIFSGLSQPAALVATQDLLSWVGLSQATASTSPSREMAYEGLSQPSALVAAIDLLVWDGVSQETELVSQPRGGG